jgi:MFS family permease
MNDIQVKSTNRNFHLLIIGQIVTLLGSALLRFVLSLYVLDITGRADIFSILYAISTIPLLLSPVGGAIADRVNRRNLMVAIDFSNGVITVIFLIILFMGHISVFMIGAVMVLLGITSALESPTVMACVPSVTSEDKLEQANGFISGISSLAQIIAPVLGGILYGMVGLNPLIIFSCAAFFLASAMEVFIRIPYTKRARERHIIPTILADMKDGFIYTVKQPVILKCMILAAILNLLLSPFFVVGVPIILRGTMQSSDTLYGIGMALTEFGMILGAVCAGLFAKKMRINALHRWLMGIALLIVPLAISLLPIVLKLGYYPSFILFFIFAIPILMVLTSISLFVITHVQRETPNELLGKVMATIMAAAQCAAPIGQILYGFLFEAFSGVLYIPTITLSVITLLIALATKVILKKEGNTNGTCSGN